MDLREGEQILKVYHRHPTPFAFDMIKAIIAIIPLFVVLMFFRDVLSTGVFSLIVFILFVGFGIIILYVSLIYWLDRLVVTNMRVIFINWRSWYNRHESEALFGDIQDIQTNEKGFIANLWIFDYGDFHLETASSHMTILFDRAPDPEGIRRFIYHLRNP